MKAILALTTALLAMPALGAKRVYIVDKTVASASSYTSGGVTSSNVNEESLTPTLIKHFEKCAEVTVTMEKSTADYILTPQQKGSILSAPNGDVLSISKALTTGGMAKDVCSYIKAHP